MTHVTTVAKAETPKKSVLERMLEVAKTPEERERAYQLAERHAQNQLVQDMAAEIAAKSWGEKVGPALRVEVVRWALEIGADPNTEVDILGGKPFLNANYWIRLVSNEPDFDHPEEIWVHHDPRADDETNTKRKALRIQYAIPDAIGPTVGLFRDQKERAAKNDPIPVRAAVLVVLHFKGRGPFIGKKWSPSRANDDVGMDHPESSALTRAWRKAAMAAVRRKPPFSSRLTNVMVTGRVIDEALKTVPEIGKTPVVTEGAQVAAIGDGGQRVGVIEHHAPDDVCSIVGDHPRADCGYAKARQEPPRA